MRTVSSCPGAGMMGSLHTEHLGANFLRKQETGTVILEPEAKVFVNWTSQPEMCAFVPTHTHLCAHTTQAGALHSFLLAKKQAGAFWSYKAFCSILLP